MTLLDIHKLLVIKPVFSIVVLGIYTGTLQMKCALVNYFIEKA